MFVRIPSASLSRWGRTSLVLALAGLPLFASCTSSEDTEPFVPASEGATQPQGEGKLVSEESACADLLQAAKAAYKRLGCDAPAYPECPGFLRPGGGSGCYEYYQGSVAACIDQYEHAATCSTLSPCLPAAERNDQLPTCEVALGAGGMPGGGGAGNNSSAGAAQGGAAMLLVGGAPDLGGAAPAVAGQATGGAG